MAGTDAYVEAPSLAPDLEVRKAIQRLRTLLVVNPGKCHLFTRPPVAPSLTVRGEERWLSDRYVMVNVTDDKALHADLGDEYPDGGELMDGMYKLTAGKGLVSCDELPYSDSLAMLDSIERQGAWWVMERTQWQVADSPANLMLAYATRFGGEEWGWSRLPLAVNDGIWAAFAAAFPGARFEYCPERPYRVTHHETTVGYIASAHLPEDQLEIAQTIVDEL
jgi:hypothetical protein